MPLGRQRNCWFLKSSEPSFRLKASQRFAYFYEAVRRITISFCGCSAATTRRSDAVKGRCKLADKEAQLLRT
jgi:hypothetical protein